MCVCVLLCGLVVGYFCGSFSSPSIPTLSSIYLLYLSRVSSGQRVRDRNFVAGCTGAGICNSRASTRCRCYSLSLCCGRGSGARENGLVLVLVLKSGRTRKRVGTRDTLHHTTLHHTTHKHVSISH